ncbi:MAG: aldehyde dehydrogenase family protein [Phaeodactylibacter sp.]|nr:aldehyde dehydrogenase family protein [Phaeodactylibacter sp.]MCB9052855.1 aldehyde dehydrogenase family protein [Lewinellaceae bacterium]
MKKTFQVISPVDGAVYAERQLATDTEIEKALALAERAQKSWKECTIAERAAICRKAVEYFLENIDPISTELSWQMGRPLRYTPFEISRGFQERAHYMIDSAEGALQDVIPKEQTGFQRFIRREPLGAVLVLAPWNYPYLTSVNVVIPAIMAGNAVILKHAQQTPLCAERYAAAFEYAGLPEGVFQYLHLSHEQVAGVIGDSRIAHVAFTGSVEGGRAIQSAVSRRFLAAGLELGGKDPAYVRPDAGLDYSIENLVDGAFFNSGQSCCGIERIYVHEKLFEPFVEGFVELTKKYVLGNPLRSETTLGPMVRAAAASFAQEQIREALQKGATALIDPQSFPAHREGTPYMAPQVLIGVDHSMQVMAEESFAPVVGIMPVKDDAEAIRLMNDSRYGLTASVWSADIDAAIRIGEQIETGTWYLNRCDYLDPALAWTGVKDSGRGCTLSALGYESLTRPKSFHLKIISQNP